LHSFATAAHFRPSPPWGRRVWDEGAKNAPNQLLLVHVVLVLVPSAAVLVLDSTSCRGGRWRDTAALLLKWHLMVKIFWDLPLSLSEFWF
jgi:hypothetical protein